MISTHAKILYLLFLCTSNCFALTHDEVIIPGLGSLNGLHQVTEEKTPYFKFLGLPYAKPPLGSLRFMSPQPIEPWNGIYDATIRKSECMTFLSGSVAGSEDCLYLNIYSPNISTKKPLPVIVFINGGLLGFNENVDLFMDHNVVFVTINYRDDIFGYLNLDSTQVPGNAGLRDVLAGLKWVNDYIRSFGGDADNISVMGFGKNALVIDLLRMSPQSNGLFHRAMMISSTGLCTTDRTLNTSKATSKLLVDEIKTLTGNTGSILNHLQSMTTTELAVLNAKIRKISHIVPSYLTFSPTVESIFSDFPAIISKPPIEYYKSCEVNNMPVIIGYTSKEFLYFHEELVENWSKENDDIITNEFQFLNDTKDILKAASKISNFYLRDGRDLDNLDAFEEVVDMMGDLNFVFPIQNSIFYLRQCTEEPIFLYRFSFRGSLNDKSVNKYGIQGATHGDEINYIFPSESVVLEPYSKENFLRQRLIKLFTSFAIDSNPVPDYDTRLFADPWIPISNDTSNFLAIDTNVFMCQNPDERRMSFLSRLHNDLIEKHF